MRIGLFNVKYSPNLGDGLLAECLELELQNAIPGTDVTSFDLAGRTAYLPGSRGRTTLLTMLEWAPASLRQLVVEAYLGRALRRQISPVWAGQLAEFDAVVVGGGNLLGDSDLNFPLKIYAALDQARRAGLPAAVFGVGASDNWSPRGEALFRTALSGVPLVYASVREESSRAIWERRLVPVGIRPAEVVHDPGLLVSKHVRARRPTGTPAPIVGIGVTHPTLLRYHADEDSPGEPVMTAWLSALVTGCVARGWTVVLFTNGGAEDEEYLKRIAPSLQAAAPEGCVSRLPRCRNPGELACFISGLDLLMAHRLHACIAAYSYGIPHIGFSWDRKVRSFFARMERARFVCMAGRDSPDDVLTLAEGALAAGIDMHRHKAVLAEAGAQVAALGARLQEAVARPADVARLQRAIAS